MERFNSQEAKILLREVFLTDDIMKALNLTEDDVYSVITVEAIEQVQKERVENVNVLKALKEELEVKFEIYRFSARLKSLPSIFGKMLKNRTLADVFGIRVIAPSVERCYAFKEWLKENYQEFDFEDRIKTPKANGYRDLKMVICYNNILVEFIIQTPKMFVDSCTIQKHSIVYPWKYHDVIKNLPAEYEYLEV